MQACLELMRGSRTIHKTREPKEREADQQSAGVCPGYRSQQGGQLVRRRRWPSESNMSWHRFKIGQTVNYDPPPRFRASSGTYVVTAVLPERDGQFEYRIKHSNEPYERIAKEGELRAS